MSNGIPEAIGWVDDDLTGQITPAGFRMTFDQATLTILVIDLAATVPADFDRDGDVDQEDFGRFQACLTGPVSPADPDCAAADLDGDGNVDGDDFRAFRSCLSGPNVPLDATCNES